MEARTRAQLRRQAVFDEVVLDRRERTGKRGDDTELVRDQARNVECRLTNADDGHIGDTACRLEARIVETGDDEGVGAAALADLFEKAGQRKRLIEIALDAGRAIGRVGGQDLDAGRSDGARVVRRHDALAVTKVDDDDFIADAVHLGKGLVGERAHENIQIVSALYGER